MELNINSNLMNYNIDTTEKYKLSDICQIYTHNYFRKDKIIKGEYPIVYDSTNIIDYHNNFNIDENTILVGWYSGVISMYDNKVMASHCFSIKPNDTINKKYLYYYLKNKQNDIINLRVGSAQPRIYKHILLDFTVPIPSNEIQEEYIKFVDSIDEKIKNNNIQNEQLTQLKYSLF